MRVKVLVVALVITQSAAAEDGVPFPELNTKVYCTELVSKMLDKAEQQIEKDKCLIDETEIARNIKPFWHLVRKSAQEDLAKTYFKEEKYHTYVTVQNYVAEAAGRACTDGRMNCKPKALNTDQMFALLRSDFYCYAKAADVQEEGRAAELQDCLAGEERMKAQLAPLWHVVHPRTQDYCSKYFLTAKQSPFGFLTTCVAPAVGHQCFAGELACTLKE